MHRRFLRSAGAVLMLWAVEASAAVFYVNVDCTNPTPPFTNWVSAATTIQDAVDAATNGDSILVTNGVYALGGRAVHGTMTNRVAVGKPVMIRSVNGSLATIIQGYQDINTTNGADAIRCVYLTNNAILVGFTLQHGATLQNPSLEDQNNHLFAGGGVFCEPGALVKDCVITHCAASDNGGGVWCESSSAIISNCVIGGCSTRYGGGVAGGVLLGCILSNNVAYSGGGAISSSLSDCLVVSNSAGYGGGASYASLNRCLLSLNSAIDGPYGSGGGSYYCTLSNSSNLNNFAQYSGGGDCFGTLVNCILGGNSANGGGGAVFGNLTGCIVSSNQAAADGGGTYFSGLNNCTVTGNACNGAGGGDNSGALNNCIIYNNTASAGDNYSGSTLSYCCTTPLPTNGFGNITNAPLFANAAAGDYRLLPNSPCIDAGTNLTGIVSTDILGLPRPMDGDGDGIARFDIGAYEFNPYRFAPTLGLSTSGFQFTVCGEPGKSVRIERSRDLVNWEFAGQVPIPIGGQTLIDPAATSEAKLFYRAMRVP